jgi:hypothetical protein
MGVGRSVDYTKSEFWAQQWATFENDFWVMLPLFVIIVGGVWWLRGKLYDAQIAGLKEQMVAIEQRFKFFVEGLDRAKNDFVDLDKQFQIYKAAVEAKGRDASPEMVDVAMTELKRENAIMSDLLAVAHRELEVSSRDPDKVKSFLNDRNVQS